MKYYNYGGISQKDIKIDSVVIDDAEYIVPATVANALASYSKRLDDERRNHEATKIRCEEISTEKYGALADRIISSLDEGVNENGSVRERLLKYSMNHYTKVDPRTNEPILEYRHELHRRIVLALKGLNPEGKPYK